MSAWTASFFAISIANNGVCGVLISCVNVFAELQKLSEVTDKLSFGGLQEHVP